MHGRQIRTLIKLLILYSLVFFTGCLNEWLNFTIFFAQLKLCRRIYTLMAVSLLKHPILLLNDFSVIKYFLFITYNVTFSNPSF